MIRIFSLYFAPVMGAREKILPFPKCLLQFNGGVSVEGVFARYEVGKPPPPNPIASPNFLTPNSHLLVYNSILKMGVPG